MQCVKSQEPAPKGLYTVHEYAHNHLSVYRSQPVYHVQCQSNPFYFISVSSFNYKMCKNVSNCIRIVSFKILCTCQEFYDPLLIAHEKLVV